MFELIKWYLDFVTEDGTAIIGYAAHCRFGAAGFRYAALRHAPPGGTSVERTSLTGVELPRLVGSSIHWRHDALEISGCWTPLGSPIRQTLFQSSRGDIEWECHQPQARVRARVGGRDLEGLGYVETLRLTLPPWDLPFHRLHWGRFITSAHWLGWIVWDDGRAGKWIMLDGHLEPEAVLLRDGVGELSGGRTLRFAPGRILCDRAVLASLGDIIPGPLRARLGPLAGMQECKQLAHAELHARTEPVDRGWALHEEVQW